MPVSYTHLEKSQKKIDAGKKKVESGKSSISQGSEQLNSAINQTMDQPVSYTHLDVYKRQVETPSGTQEVATGTSSKVNSDGKNTETTTTNPGYTYTCLLYTSRCV